MPDKPEERSPQSDPVANLCWLLRRTIQRTEACKGQGFSQEEINSATFEAWIQDYEAHILSLSVIQRGSLQTYIAHYLNQNKADEFKEHFDRLSKKQEESSPMQKSSKALSPETEAVLLKLLMANLDVVASEVERLDEVHAWQYFSPVLREFVPVYPKLNYEPLIEYLIKSWKLGQGTRQTWTKLVESLRSEAQTNASDLVAVDYRDFKGMDMPKREALLEPWLFTQSLNMVHASRGIGKTHFALGLAWAVATGGEFLKWKAPSPRRVLYVDGEMSAADMQKRLSRIAEGSDIEPAEGMLRVVTPDIEPHSLPDLATLAGQEVIDRLLSKCPADLIIIDNLSCLVCGGGDENEAKSWQEFQDWLLQQRRIGRSVLFLHHTGKAGAQRGTSKREDVLDVVIYLKRPTTTETEEGCFFRLEFEKSRSVHGQAILPIEATLQTQSDGRQKWTVKRSSIALREEIKKLIDDGYSKSDIGRALGVSRKSVIYHANALAKDEDAEKIRQHFLDNQVPEF